VAARARSRVTGVCGASPERTRMLPEIDLRSMGVGLG
jgi:hypothetical protein